MTKFYGTGIAMVTPFSPDGSVDYNGLKNLIDFQIDGGVEYLVSLGTTGEVATLTKEEKKAVWSFTADAVAGRVPLIAGIGGNNTGEIIESLKSFNTTGYDAILSVSPYYSKPTQEGIYQHYKAVAEASPLPLMLYNVPGRTGSNMSAETTLRLAHDCSNVFGTKEASGSFEQFNRIARDKPKDFLLVSGDDPVTLPMIAIGAVGIISVVGNAYPRILSDMVRLCLDQKYEAARPAHFSLLKLIDLCFAEGNPAGVKAILKELGVCGDTLRLPLTNVSAATLSRIREAMKEM